MKFLYTLILSTMISLGAMASGPSGDFLGDAPFLEVYTVSPNPVTKGYLNVTLKSIDPNQALQLRVYNLIGQEMHKEDLGPYNGEQKIRLDLSAFPKGLYMIEISNGQETKIKRISVL